MARKEIAPYVSWGKGDEGKAINTPRHQEQHALFKAAVLPNGSVAQLYVPASQLSRYSFCSGVRVSIVIPMERSFNLPTSLSMSPGTG